MKTTPFSSGEVWRLWRRFTQLDVDNSGFLLITVRLCIRGQWATQSSRPAA